jgi:4-hydroxybenzoyl-CoA thioesterase
VSERFDMPMRIRFAHCDPAGIVYFPQYLVMTNMLVEEWFNERLRIDYAHMIQMRRVGLPIVKLDCEFSKPSRMGETVTLSLSVTRIGRRSIHLAIVAHGDDGERFCANQVLVFVSQENGQSIDIPDDIVAALVQFAPHAVQSEEQRS